MFCSRRERAMSRSRGRGLQRATPAPAPVFSVPQSPTSTWSPTPSPTSPLPSHMYYAPIMDEPLDLIKKPRKEPEEKTNSTPATQIQVNSDKRNCKVLFMPSRECGSVRD